MVFRRGAYQQGTGFGGLGSLGSGTPVPRDLIVLLAVLFATFSFQFFPFTAVIPAFLRLTPAVFLGQVWRIATYPFVGYGAPSLWFLLVLLMVFWFGRDIFWRLGRRRFWRLLLISGLVAGLIASVVQLLLIVVGWTIPLPYMFSLIQGQHMLLTILIAAFANLYGEATILFFFILPVKARWFLWLEILFGFIGFLGTRDFAGFIGVVVAVVLVTALLTPGGWRQLWYRWRHQLERLLVELRLARLRRKRRHFDVFDGGGGDVFPGGRGDSDRWVH